jgi:hydroxymethylbilane synthase
MKITVGGRKSPLSQAQIDEVYDEIKEFHANIIFDKILTETTGDLDQNTSLKTLGKTDFFTKEIDELLMLRKCRIAVHSAKDLPENIHPELSIIAITRGVDSSDSLVINQGLSFKNLKEHAVIAASSTRREEAVKQLRPDATFKDVRGQIQARLNLLFTGQVDGVVIAEAALIRLKLTALNRIRLDAPTTPLQGQLAILARRDDTEMEELFSCLDTRQCIHK